jgi:hypothetical protein
MVYTERKVAQDVLDKEFVGKAVEFSMEANTPLKTFGVPRTAMREVRLFSKPGQPQIECLVYLLVPTPVAAVFHRPQIHCPDHRTTWCCWKE